MFRRAQFDGSQLSVRRGPGDGPLRVTLSGASTSPDNEGTTLADVSARGFVLACARFALGLAEAIERADSSQTKNLRLRALTRSARAIVDTVSETNANDSLQNPEPESYRSFGLPRAQTGRGTWEHGGKMRFVPRWVATVPNIDLRATFQCGDKIIVGSQRETACLLRDSGRVLWRVASTRAASVVTTFGLARLGFDGRVELNDLETGGLRFTTHVAPRTAGGATGALVNGPALPKLVVIDKSNPPVPAANLVRTKAPALSRTAPRQLPNATRLQTAERHRVAHSALPPVRTPSPSSRGCPEHKSPSPSPEKHPGMNQ